MDKLTSKHIDHLIRVLVDGGKLNPHSEAKVAECRNALEYGLDTRDNQCVDKLVSQVAEMWREIDNVAAYLYRSFGKLPYKPPAKTIAEEMAQEAQDIKDHIETEIALRELHPEDADKSMFHEDGQYLLENTSILDTAPYEGEREVYANNLFIHIFREAKAQKTSMHEICRRKGLVYGLLIF